MSLSNSLTGVRENLVYINDFYMD